MTSLSNAALLVFVDNPDHAILLLLTGILFIYAEFNKPGTVVLGCFGALLTMLALYGLGTLPLSPPAVLLSLAGVILVGVGCWFPLHGVMPVAGTLCLAFGLSNLTVGPPIHPLVAIAVAVFFGGITTWLVRIALRARRNKSLVGPQAMVGKTAIVKTPLAPTGMVEVRGELWRATLAAGGAQPAGAAVTVLGVRDLELLVGQNPADSSPAE